MFYTTYELSRYTNMRLILELNIETEWMDFSLVIFLVNLERYATRLARSN